ncbi:MAG: dTDP-glucose 4,6-dehydratase [Alistipes sp.]|jgi:dTDP-glucose 4,6-dehydratase|nr:dTDP-glucose 4,6-dehydratase [Alistipes sp.]
MKNILITGGAGFIGSHVVRHFVEKYPDYQIVCLDKLTYAGVQANLTSVAGSDNYTFIEGDVCDTALLGRIFATHDIDSVIHLAAESHVDRSIGGPTIFAQTNVMGTLALLEAARAHWSGSGGVGGTGAVGGTANGSGIGGGFEGKKFYQISTDEVYGALGATGFFTEESRYDPHSPYSASKAAADHFVRAYHDTYGIPTVISNCSNNYGPHQYPEKLIPLMIAGIVAGKSLPVYGDGSNVRDWIWVGDHVEAIDAVFHRGVVGETYLAGGGNELTNIELVRMLVRLTDAALGREAGFSDRLVTFVADRAGHDFRYAVDISKISRELGWRPRVGFEEGLRRTVEWYTARHR